MKRVLLALAAAMLLMLGLTGCGLQDVLLYLYGGDEWIDQDEEPAYARCDAENGVTVLYDTNLWQTPVAPQEDTVSLTAGNQLDYTAVLLQVTDVYTDFLAQSGEELSGETGTIEYELSFTVPQAEVQAVRYDCGSYQTIFAQIDYEGGGTIYVTAATRSSDYQPIIDLLQTVYPTGQAPESAAGLEAPTVDAVTGDRQKSLA